jgi:hypothetical protein
MTDGITYHHETLATHEVDQAYRERLIAKYEINCRPSFRVHTADWIQEADNREELKQLIDDAALCGLDYTLEILSF